MIAQTVVKKIALPINAVFSGTELFPVLDSCCHSRFTRKRDYCVLTTRSSFAFHMERPSI
jgi:hypothetical protein